MTDPERIQALIEHLECEHGSPLVCRVVMLKAAAQLRADHPAQGVAMGEPSPEIVLLLTTARVLRAQTKIRTVGDEYPGDSEDLEALNEALAPFDPIAPPVAPAQPEATPAAWWGSDATATADQAEQRINFAAGNAAADDPGCTKESVRAAAAIMASSRPSLAAQAKAVERAHSVLHFKQDEWRLASDDALVAAAATLKALPGVVEALEGMLHLFDRQPETDEPVTDDPTSACNNARAALRRLGGAVE